MPDYEVQTTLLNAEGNSLSAEMKTFYEKQLIETAQPALVHDQFGTQYPIPKNGGKTIEFRKIDSLPKALTQLTEGVTPQGNKLNVSKVIAEVGQYGDFVPISDMLDLTAIDPMMVETTKRLAGQASRTLDTITREVLTAGTNKVFAPKSDGTAVELREDVTADCELTPRLIRLVAARLKRQNAPKIDDSYVAIIHPDIACDLMGNEEWIEAHKYAQPENIYFGEIGKIAGVRFVETTEAKVIGPGEIVEGVCRMKLRTALNSTGSTTIAVEEEITSAQAAALSARISGGETVKIYVGGKEATLTGATAGQPHGERGRKGRIPGRRGVRRGRGQGRQRHLPHAGIGRGRLWRNHHHRRRIGAHREGARLRRHQRPAQPARHLRLEGHQNGGTPGGAIYGAHRARQPHFLARSREQLSDIDLR